MPLRPSVSRHKKFLLLFCALCYLYFRGVGDHGLFDPLEGLNASVSLNMASRGEPFYPMAGELPFAGSTLGFWWLNALSLCAFGWSEFATRFFPACAALLIAVAAAVMARPEGRRAAYYAALVSGTTLLSFLPSQLSSVHTLYAALMGLALTGFVRGRGDPRFRPLAHAGAILALVVYGPAGFLLPWLTLFLYSQLVDDPDSVLPFLLNRPGLFITAGIGLGYLLLLKVKNPVMLSLLGYLPSSTTLLPFLPVMMTGFFPWCGYLLQAFVSACPRSMDDLLNPEGPRLFLLLWTTVFAFSALLSEDALALTACLPSLAVLTALYMDESVTRNTVEGAQRATALNLLLTTFLLAGGLPLLFSLYPELGVAFSSLLVWVFFSLLFLFASWYYARTKQLVKLWRHTGLIALLSLLPLAGAFDLVAEATSLRSVGLYLRGELKKGEVVVQYAMNRPSLFFYTAHDSVLTAAAPLPDIQGQRSLGDPELHRLWKETARVYLLIDRDQPLSSPLPESVSDVYRSGRLLLLSNRSHAVPVQAAPVLPTP
ncbi:MAG: hypothetical protein GX256_10070 [Fretibacterium sp.]|nr:hypothetical protein [Fretibacterium sp.]